MSRFPGRRSLLWSSLAALAALAVARPALRTGPTACQDYRGKGRIRVLLRPFRADTADEMAAIARAQWESGLGGGILATCPIPAADELAADVFAAALAQAEREAEEQGIAGPAVTPFLLSRIAALTEGASVAANRALLLNNALWAARFAASLFPAA